MELNNYHLVIIRSYGDNINLNSYNCQELGLAKALVKRGMKVTLLMPRFANTQKELIDNIDGVDIAYIKVKWKIHARYCWYNDFERALSLLNPSFIQVHDMDLLMTWRSVRWAKKNEIPCFLIQGPYDKWKQIGLRQLNELYNRTFGKYVIKNVTRIGVKTELASTYLNKYYTCRTQQTVIGLDTDAFKNDEVHDWRNDLNISDKKILLYVGSIQPRRNPLFLVDILKKLPEDYVLVVVGGGVQQTELKEKIVNDNMGDRCFILGKLKQKELPSLYQTANCFLLASDYEILGMVIMEAMYFGLPVISTKTTGADFVINSDDYGIIIENKDPNQWALSIQHLLDDKKKYEMLSSMCHRRIIDNFVWDKTVEGFLHLYFK